MQVCAGAVYSFGSIADDLKRDLELKDAHQQGLIAISGNLGLWVGSFTGGLLADARGPRVAMLGGAGLFFIGYGEMYLALSHRGPQFLRDPVLVAFFYLLAGLGSGWVMNSAMFTNTQNWSTARRAKVVSILATLMGAAATIWSTLFTGCIGGRAEQITVTTAVAAPGASARLGTAVGWAGGLAIASPAPQDFYYEVDLSSEGSDGGGGQQPQSATTSRYSCVGGWVNGDVASFFGLLALVLPAITLFGAAVSFRMEDAAQRTKADTLDGGDEAVARRLAQGVNTLVAVLVTVGVSSVLAVTLDGDVSAVRVDEWAPLFMLALLGLLTAILGGQQDLLVRLRPGRKEAESRLTASLRASLVKPEAVAGPAHTPRTALHSVEFWLVFCVMATVCGSNSATMNVISTIINDRRAGSRVVARITNVLLMTTSALVRIMAGQLMSSLPDKPVHVWIVLTSCLASILGQALFTLDSTPMLFTAVIVVGASDGCFWSSLPIVSNSLFGLKNSGGIYGMLNCFGAVGFISLSIGVQPSVYAKNTAAGMIECGAGVVCFRGFHVVCLLYSVGGTIAALGLIRVVAMRRQRSAAATWKPLDGVGIFDNSNGRNLAI